MTVINYICSQRSSLRRRHVGEEALHSAKVAHVAPDTQSQGAYGCGGSDTQSQSAYGCCASDTRSQSAYDRGGSDTQSQSAYGCGVAQKRRAPRPAEQILLELDNLNGFNKRERLTYQCAFRRSRSVRAIDRERV